MRCQARCGRWWLPWLLWLLWLLLLLWQRWLCQLLAVVAHPRGGRGDEVAGSSV